MSADLRISTAAQCRALDADLIALGVPGIALMELASKGVADVVRAHFAEEARRGVHVLCGAGNNGGDGYAAARWLARRGFPVTLEAFGTPKTADARTMATAAEAHGLAYSDGRDAGLFIDAVFGTGLSREVGGELGRRFDAIEAGGRPCVAVDIPSGLAADTGAVLGRVIPATRTVTFGRMKPAFFTSARQVCGEVSVVDIGLDRTAHTTATVIGRNHLVLPTRGRYGHKHRTGHVGMVAGSRRYAGAALLACRGALASGVGLVTLFAEPGVEARFSLLPEVMVRPLSDATTDMLQRFDAVAVGPGLEAVPEWLPEAMASPLPMVVDAGALESVDVDVQQTVFTPHAGEAGRMLSQPWRTIEADRFAASRRLPGVSVLKGPWSLVHHQGRQWVSPFATGVLSTGGSGDVLAGFIAGLMARGVPPEDAAVTGVWLHGRAGESLESIHQEGWSATEIATALRESFREAHDVGEG